MRFIKFDLLRPFHRDRWATDRNLTKVIVALLFWGPHFGVPKCDFWVNEDGNFDSH